MTDMEIKNEGTNSASAGKSGETRKRLRGFASMDRALLRQISSKGGKVAHERGRAHEFTPEEARLARRKGVLAAQKRASALQGSSDDSMVIASANPLAQGPLGFEASLDPGSLLEAQQTLQTINQELGQDE